MKKNFKFLSSIFNESQIIFDKEEILSELLNCVGVESSVLGIVRPTDKFQIVSLIKECQSRKIECYVFSTGNNWGYGSKNPVESGCLLIDLSLMVNISEVDDVLGSVVIEPGVTQGKLCSYLREQNFDLIINATGAGPDCSVIGNCLERGFGVGNYNESFDMIISMEVILPSGDLISTGYSHFENSKVSSVRSCGIGPDLNGLFAQSNLGIVVSARIKLQRKPECCELLVAGVKDYESVFSVIDKVRDLKSYNLLPNTVQIFNRLRTVSVLMGRSNLNENQISQDDIDFYSDKYSLSEWNLLTCVWGKKSQLKVMKKEIKKSLGSCCSKLIFFSLSKINLLKKFPGVLSFITRLNIKELSSSLESSYKFYNGEPFRLGLETCYFRNSKDAISYNPAKENCGLLWVSPICSAFGPVEKEVLDIINSVFKEFEFDVFLTINVINERQITNICGLVFNKDNLEEVERAKKCHKKVIKKLIENGFYSYRLGIEDMSQFIKSDDVFWQSVLKIKNSFDPNHILSNGRYCIKDDK